MSTIELKHIIIEQLSKIEDVTFLNELKKILDKKIIVGTYNLSEFEKNRIQSARKQVINKTTITHDHVQKEINQWLNSK